MKQRQPQQSGIGEKYNNDVAVAITETPLDNTTGSTLQNRRQQQQYNNAGQDTSNFTNKNREKQHFRNKK